MNTPSRLRTLIPAATAGLLAIALFTTSACSGGPVAPDPGTTDGQASSASRSVTAAPPPTMGEQAPDVTFAQGESASLSAQAEGLTSASRSYASPTPSSCIQSFYDASFYNWLAFRNVCSQTIMIAYIAVNPGYGGSAMTLRSGQKGSTGYSRSEVAAKRGYQLYSCPAGYIPVDASNRYVNRINTRFWCLKQ